MKKISKSSKLKYVQSKKKEREEMLQALEWHTNRYIRNICCYMGININKSKVNMCNEMRKTIKDKIEEKTASKVGIQGELKENRNEESTSAEGTKDAQN